MPAIVPFIPAIMGGVGAIGGLIGQKKQQGKTNAFMQAGMTGLQNLGQGYGNAGLDYFKQAGSGYGDILTNPEKFTGGTAAQIGKQTQGQLSTISRTMGRSGAAGATARDLYTENVKNNMAAQINAKLAAIQGLGNLGSEGGRIGTGAFGSMVGGANETARTNMLQAQQNQNIWGTLGGSLYDIFKQLPIGKGLPSPRGGNPGDFIPGLNVPFSS